MNAFNESVINRVGSESIVVSEINNFKYDSALGLLITKLIPQNVGLLGFEAALLGAIVSSLALIKCRINFTHNGCLSALFKT